MRLWNLTTWQIIKSSKEKSTHLLCPLKYIRVYSMYIFDSGQYAHSICMSGINQSISLLIHIRMICLPECFSFVAIVYTTYIEREASNPFSIKQKYTQLLCILAIGYSMKPFEHIYSTWNVLYTKKYTTNTQYTNTIEICFYIWSVGFITHIAWFILD